MGSGRKEPVAVERTLATVARRSLHLRRDVPAGSTLSFEDLVALRPGTGISPSAAIHVIGRALRRPVRAGTMLTEDDLE